MSTSLVQLPALRQSMVETAACPRAYVEIYINGRQQPDSIPSERGTEIHKVMSQYVDHCVKHQVRSDWVYFNKLAAAAGPVAGPILDGIRDTYEVDWERVYGTEITLMLDEDFIPSAGEGLAGANIQALPGHRSTGLPPAYTGTLDVILLSHDGLRAKIDDYKSHPAVFDADTFQSTLYPFMLFKHMPTLQSITFELNFVRYTKCVRSVQWKRTDMPEMQAIISRARERQTITHNNPDAALALPCKSCAYCPLAKSMTCPIAESNEYTLMTPPQRLMWREWMRRMNAINNPILKTYAEVEGAVRYEDGNGRVYEYDSMPVPSTCIPLDKTTIQVLDEYSSATGDDWETWKLNVSSTKLKSRLDTNKRAALREIFEDSIYETSTKPKFAVRTPDEGIIDESSHYGEE